VRHGDGDLTVITGDLADAGDPDAYAILEELLRSLRMPYRLVLGNHDRRGPFRAAFPDMPVDENGFVQSVLDAPGRIGRLIFLDSLEENTIGGVLCEKRLGWLEARLAEASGRPVTIFIHHPPLSVGVPHFENICMAEPGPFLDLLARHDGNVRHMFIGHLHIPVTGVLAGNLPFTSARSCNHHMVLDFQDAGASWAEGGPNYNVIVLEDDSLFVHAFDLLESPRIGYGEVCAGP
jgi:3',5'-cyclic-AMP phosphodiesterase